MKVYGNARVEISLDDSDMSRLMLKKALELSGKTLMGDNYYLHDYIVSTKEIDGDSKEVIIHTSKGYGPYDDEHTIVSFDEHAVMCLKLAKHFDSLRYKKGK